MNLAIVTKLPEHGLESFSYVRLYQEELYMSFANNGGVDESDDLNHVIKSACYDCKDLVYVDFYATDLEGLKAILAVGNGYSLIPKLALAGDSNLLCQGSSPKKVREFYMFYRKSDDRKESYLAMAKLTNDIMSHVEI